MLRFGTRAPGVGAHNARRLRPLIPSSLRCSVPAVALAVCYLAACESYRVEYRPRPAYYEHAALGGLPEQAELEDGTRIVYRTPPAAKRQPTPAPPRAAKQSADDAADLEGEGDFPMRDEQADGTIVLRAYLPQHVLSNALECLHSEEYEVLYEQVLAERTRREWEARGLDVEDFADYFAEHRFEMIRTLSRLHMGLSHHDTILTHLEEGAIELRLQPSIARQTRFRLVRMIPEGVELRLLTIR